MKKGTKKTKKRTDPIGFVQKYVTYFKYGIVLLLALALVWGGYSYTNLTRLEAENRSLLASNEALKTDMKVKLSQWEDRFNALEKKAKQFEVTMADLNKSYAILVKKNKDLQAKLDSIKIPVEKEAKVAKFKELGYDGETVVAPAPAPYDGVLFDWPNSDKLLQDLMALQVLEEMNTALQESIVLLEKKVSVQEEIIENTEEEVRVALDRAEYAEQQGLEKDKIIEDQNKVNQTAISKAKRSPIISGIIGVALGILIAALLL